MNSQQAHRPRRRQAIKGAGVIGAATVLLVGGGVIGWQTLSDRPSEPVTAEQPGRDPSLEAPADAAVSGGPGKDGIPSIDKPRFVPADDADFLSDDEPVFGLRYRGEVRAYPQQVLVWHEIVNDSVGGEPLAVTYCPLTGTVIGFRAPSGTQDLTFGTTGRLVNSNLLMYDRQTGSEWPQLLGTAVSGPLKGTRLDTVPLVWTTWKLWRTAHPGTEVLSTDTGALRSYGSDPYGSYDSYPDRGGYYAKGPPIFPVLATSDRFDDKDVVVGVRAGSQRLAIDKGPRPHTADRTGAGRRQAGGGTLGRRPRHRPRPPAGRGPVGAGGLPRLHVVRLVRVLPQHPGADMSRLLTVLAKAGDAWDTTVAAIAATPGRVRAALAVRRHRRAALISATLTLVVYLFSIGDLVISGSGRLTGAPVVQAAPEQLFQARAPYLFEPVLAWLSVSEVVCADVRSRVHGAEVHGSSAGLTRHGHLLRSIRLGGG